MREETVVQYKKTHYFIKNIQPPENLKYPNANRALSDDGLSRQC